MEVIQRKSEETEIKIPLINHYKEEEDGDEEPMEESLVGRRARVSNNEAANGNGHPAIDELTDSENFDKSEVEEIVNEDGAENGHLSNHKNVYFDNNEGPSTQRSEPGNNFKFEDFGGGGLDVDIQKVISSVINGTKTGADFKGEILSDFGTSPRVGNTQQEDSTNASAQTRNAPENLQVDIVDEIDEEVIELEFERAVDKMHAHHDYEMYCPNCSNRITKVVLRRRKIAKRVPPQPPKKPLDLFGCLSCFSIFTNAGNKLNPFRLFGKGREPESTPLQQQQDQQQQTSNELSSTSSTVSNVQQQPQQTSNEFSSTSTTVSNVQQQHSSNGLSSTSTTVSNVQQQHTSNELSSKSVVTSSITTSSTQIKGKGFDLFSIFGKRRDEGRNGLNAQPSPTSEKGNEASIGNSNQAYASKDAALHGKTLLGSSATKVAAAVALAGNHYQTSSLLQGSAPNGRVNIDSKNNLDGVIREEKQHVMPGSEIKEEPNITAQQHQGNDASIASDNSNEEYAGYNANGTTRHGKELLGSAANKVTAAVAIAGNHFQSSSLQGSKPDRDLIIDINNNQEDFISSVKHPVSLGSEIREQVDINSIQQPGGDVQVVIEEETIRRETSQFTVGTTAITVPETVTEVQSPKSFEILKAIVYGGLMESIASLSIVSSAAASGTSTMKVLALGLAYLVSGLVVIGHNLRDLRHDELSGSIEAVSRYEELLGRRENYLLHAVVVVLSYLIFGIVPPLTYAFTFRESDDRDYKLLAVAGVSLLCVIILAISKAYTRGQHKFSVYLKAVVYYVSCAVMVGGIAFAVGDLGKKLMVKWGWWDSSPVQSISNPEIKSIYPGLASY